MKHAAVLLAGLLVSVSFAGCLEPSAPSGKNVSVAGAMNAGWKPIVPVSRATLVEYDPFGYGDDLCYLAALPTAVFAGPDALFASPLLYYRDQGVASSPEERALNDTMGVTYLMRDWLAVNGHMLERVDVIGNAPYEGQITAAYGTDPFDTSAALALDNWEYSKEVAVAPVDPDVTDAMETVSGSVGGSVEAGDVLVIDFSGSKLPDPVEPDFHDFDVPAGYEYITAHLNWTWYGQTIGPDGSGASERGKDLDLQLYDMAIGEVSASEDWNVIDGSLYRPFDPPDEDCRCVAHHEGAWKAAVTYMPTKGIDAPGQIEEMGRAYYNIRIKLFPGAVFEVPDEAAFSARDVTIELDSSASVGLVLLGPSGEEMASVMDDSAPKRIELDRLGTGRYSVLVVSLDGSGGDFTVDYSWDETSKPISAHMLASAGQAAVYASMRNIPLIYVGPNSVPSSAKRALDKLGVEKVKLFNLGDYSGVGGKFDFRSWDEPAIDVSEVRSYETAYGLISGLSEGDAIVFTTASGWRYWYPGSNGPEGHDERGTSIGPAAYAAAVHGAPLLVTDVHPELNGPVAWHNAYWARAFQTRQPPGVGSMVLTGHRVYDFLGEMGLDGPDHETIVTVADHLDIGQAWDRTFVGVALPGRIFGSPADQAMWVSRNVLYPALIFANPAVNPVIDQFDSMRITGSKSESRPVFHVVEDEAEVEAPFALAQSWVSYQHRFNERASKYWGTNYVGPAGLSPYWSESDDPIDEGNTNYPGDRGEGQYYPDMTCSEVIPFYGDKAGYSSVFTTSLEPTMENLNRGAIMWLEVMHGGHQSYDDGSGVVGFWNSEDQPETDPWRGYEADGCTEEDPLNYYGPDTFAMNKQSGADAHRSGSDPTGDVFEDHDGVVIAIGQQMTQTVLVTGIQMDDLLGNIHSMGFVAGSCLIADTYLHLMLVRHGSIFQVIDPWLTSWYMAFAMSLFMRGIALGRSVGEAYAEGMHNVGIEYLTGQWWWDIFENVVYFGDPDLHVYAPAEGLSWDRPASLNATGAQVGHHRPFGASEHPGAIEGNGTLILAAVGGAAAAGAAAVWFIRRRRAAGE